LLRSAAHGALSPLKRCACSAGAQCLLYEALEQGGHLAVLVADVRRAGRYYPLGRDVMNMEPCLGAMRSVIIKAQHNCRSDNVNYARMKHVPIKHEYCVVFEKAA